MHVSGLIFDPVLHSFLTGQDPQGILVKGGKSKILFSTFSQCESLKCFSPYFKTVSNV
jgi:hypothetical protein